MGEVIRIDGTGNRADLPKYLYSLVVIQDTWLDDTFEEMELTCFHAERYKQTVHYDGVYYYDQALREKGLYISMAEEMPVTALLDPRFGKALYRFLGSRGREEAGFLEELAARGSKLYVNHGRAEDYIVVARRVTVKA
ncbi:MAG: hypothetical protein LBL15_04025 [Oscillospiraceae bacterium]|jgi:hypothetical protein|nr:hypothetical protein [Oscillospiraceae bacterium]